MPKHWDWAQLLCVCVSLRWALWILELISAAELVDHNVGHVPTDHKLPKRQRVWIMIENGSRKYHEDNIVRSNCHQIWKSIVNDFLIIETYICLLFRINSIHAFERFLSGVSTMPFYTFQIIDMQPHFSNLTSTKLIWPHYLHCNTGKPALQLKLWNGKRGMCTA